MDVPEASKHGKKSTSQKLEDQKKIYTDWANHYLAKSGCPRLIKDLSQDVTDGVLLAQIIQIIANEKVEDINGSPRSQTQMIENVDTCLSFLDARGVNVQGLSAEEIRNGNLKSILGLFFILSRYKQQQQQQQQYYQSLVELSQQTSSSAPSTSSPKTHDMQSSLTARYASSPGHSGIGSPQKKNTRLPGPSRVPAAGSGASRSPGSSNLNRRSQSFNSIDKSKPLQYASGNDREAVRAIPVPSGMNGSGGIVSTSQSGQQLASAIPSPTTGKSWRSKSMNLKHSATSSMLASPTHSSSTTPSPQALEGPQSHGGDGSKAGSGVAPPHRSMLEKFRLIHPRSASRASPSMAEMALQEEDDLSEYGEDSLAVAVSTCSSVGSTATAKQMSAKTSASALSAPSKSLSTTASYPKASGGGSRSNTQGKEDKVKSAKTSRENPSKEESTTESSKKTSKISSLIPKGGRSSSGKKDGGSSASSCIPKPGLKAPSTTTPKPQSQTQAALTSCGNVRGNDADRAKLGKGGQGGSFYIQRSTAGQEGKRTFMTSSTSTSALAGSSGMLVGGGGGGALGAVQLPQQQQHNHPNTATVAPFMYRTFSENDCTTVAPADPCLSPTKGELVYSKTAKQCLEEISGEDAETRRMRTVKNIADLRQNLEETMSNLRGTQISHSTLETTFDTTVTTEVNGRNLPALTTRSSPMSWRLGPSQAPRLQAGDAPSTPSSYSSPRASTGGSSTNAGRYSSPSDPSRHLTEGGLHMYSRNAVRASDVALPRETRGNKEMAGDIDSWDDSSSVSSGLSDTLDNISTDDLNTPAYSSGSSSHKNKSSQSQKGSRSKHAKQDVSSTWAGAEDLKKVEEELDASMDPGSGPSRWKPSSSSSSSQTQGQYEDTGQKTAALAQMSQTGSWRRGMTAQVGITPPRTKGTPAGLKTQGKTDDAKASEKGKAPSKSPAAIQRSPSDAGRSSGDEGKKPPSGIARPPTTSSFGYKKLSGPPGTLITPSGATLASGSATLGKAPKSSAALCKGTSIGGARKTSLDGSQPQDDGILLSCSGSKVTLQYRSLPRPAKSSSGGAAGRSGHRSSSSSIDSNVSGKSAAQAGAKRRDGKVNSDRSSPVTVTQTDKEKVGGLEPEPTVVLSTSPKSSPTSSSACQSGLRQPGTKYPDIASPTFRRLFGTKASSKPSSPGTPDSGKCPSILGSPHGTLARQASLDSPSSGTGSLGSGGGLSGASSPLYGKTPDLCTDSLASSPASGLSLPSNSRPWPACSSSAGSKDTLSCQSMTSLHTSSESIDLPLGHHGPKVTRTGSVKSTLSEG